MKLPAWTTTTKSPFSILSKPEEIILNKEWVNVSVTFGDPRRKCSGSGICQIMGAGQLKPPDCLGARVNGFLTKVDNRHLQMIFDVRQLSFLEKKQYFTEAKMHVKSDLSLPFEITRALGVSEKAVISPGAYLIQRDGSYLHYYVLFRNLYKRA